MFFQSEVEFLGMVVSGKEIMMSKVKVVAITKWKLPMHVKGVCSFLGLVNFYQQFIANFIAVLKPLMSLIKKDVPFIWGVEQQLVFDTLKAKFTSASIFTF